MQIAPDLTDGDKRDIAVVALRTGIDGLIISNTTISRPPAVHGSPVADEVLSRMSVPMCIRFHIRRVVCRASR